jgi:hypothetical protein
MRPPSIELDAWISFARRHRLAGWAAFFVESLDPLASLGAQALYLIEPIAGGRSRTRAAAEALEDDEARRALSRRLAEDERD